LQAFEYTAPKSLEEALFLLDEKSESSRVLAGGTDLLVQMRGGRWNVDRIVDVKHIPELNEISYTQGGELRIGASVSCCRIYEDSNIVSAFPGLIDAAGLIGGIQIQGRATLGGNLCNAAPSADGVPPMMVLGARCLIAGPQGTREIAVQDFCTAPGKNVLQKGEMLVSIRLPAPVPSSGAHYLRFIPRNEMDIAVAGVGASIVLNGGGDRLLSARVALASVGPTPIMLDNLDVEGQPIDDSTIQKVAEAARAAAKPISDMRGTIEQRLHLVEVLTRRALQGAIRRARGG
jgi:CO/xanthine dehydrogenase FAD-binding subunit